MRWKRLLQASPLLALLFLPACSNLELDELTATTASATAGAVTAAVTGNPGAVLIVSAGAGAATSVVTPPSAGPDVQDFRGEDGELSFGEALAYMWSNFTQHLISIGILAGAFWFLSTWLGMRKKRPEERSLEKQVSMLVDKVGRMKE